MPTWFKSHDEFMAHARAGRGDAIYPLKELKEEKGNAESGKEEDQETDATTEDIDDTQEAVQEEPKQKAAPKKKKVTEDE